MQSLPREERTKHFAGEYQALGAPSSLVPSFPSGRVALGNTAGTRNGTKSVSVGSRLAGAALLPLPLPLGVCVMAAARANWKGYLRLSLVSCPIAHTDGELKGKEWKGIYALDGDTLTTCDNAPNLEKGRPAAFEAKGGSGYVLITFKREKP